MLNAQEMLDLMEVTVPEGTKGHMKIERFEITEEDVARQMLRAMTQNVVTGRGYTKPGMYTKLLGDNVFWMSDTYDERKDHFPALMEAESWGPGARVLVGGLGIGMVINAMIQMPEVAEIDVIEMDRDVIDLVADHYVTLAEEYGTVLTIHRGSVFEPEKLFVNGDCWDAVWMDIWPFISADNLPEFQTLAKLYESRTEWIGFWAEEECNLMKEHEDEMEALEAFLEQHMTEAQKVEARAWAVAQGLMRA